MKLSNSEIPKPVINIHNEFIVDSKSDRIWDILIDINNWGKWNPSIDHAVIYGPCSQGARLKFSSGKWDFDSTIIAFEPGKSIVFRSTTIGMKMMLSFAINSSNDRTKILIDISISGWLSKILKKSISKELNEIVETTMTSLKAIAGKKGGE